MASRIVGATRQGEGHYKKTYLATQRSEKGETAHLDQLRKDTIAETGGRK